MPTEQVLNQELTDIALKEPPFFRVIYLDDDTTTMEFVIDSLVGHFGYETSAAEQLTIDIHDRGSAVVAVLPFEIAEQKGVEVTLAARSFNYPLQIKLEPDLASA